MPNVSFFGTIYETQAEDDLPLDIILHEIRTGRWEDLVNTIRGKKSEKEKDKLKTRIPRITYSGKFSNRSDDGLIEHSGVIAMDLDDLEDAEAVKTLLSQDKYVYACFLSTGGFGLTVLFKINPAKHRESYLGISNYLLVNYGQVTDPGSISPSKPFGVTFDPNIYISENKVPIFKNYPKERKVDKVPNFAFAKDDFEEILRTVVSRGVNLCEEYNEWLKIGFAFASKFGENGRGYFHAVSSVSKKYNVIKTDKQYTYCVKRSKFLNVATIATFYWYAKEAGIQITSERTTKIKKATVNGKAAGLKKSQIIENLKKYDNITEADEVVNEIFDSVGQGDGGDSTIEKLEIFISSNYNIERNEITRYLESNHCDMNQRDLNSIYIAAKKIISEVSYDLTERLLMSDFIKQYNPLVRFFEELPETNLDKFGDEFQTPLIDLLSSTIPNSDDYYTKYFVRKWIVGMISAAHGEHSPLVLVLIGEKQGTGKTEWFRRLFPKELKRYYAESKLDAGKDDEILMTQKLLIMDDEMAGKSKIQVQRLKELTSKQYFSLREPYGRANVDLLRIAVLGGTSNFKTILNDPTGNRRTIPVPVDDMINHELYNSIDKKELFAEAYSLWRSGFEWRVLSKHDMKLLKKYELEFESLNLEAELILKYLTPSNDIDWLTSSEIKVELENLTNQKLSLDMIGKQLSRLGFEKKSVRIDGNAAKRWGVKRVNRPNGETKKDDSDSDLPF